VGGTQVPRVDPKTLEGKSRGGSSSLRSLSKLRYVPDGDYSDRANPADLCSTYREQWNLP
jgi:hypothetical protein